MGLDGILTPENMRMVWEQSAVAERRQNSVTRRRELILFYKKILKAKIDSFGNRRYIVGGFLIDYEKTQKELFKSLRGSVWGKKTPRRRDCAKKCF